VTAERGAVAPFVAGSLMTLILAAAWAVDVSGFYAGLRGDQTIADLACLAGAAELPESPAAAVLAASDLTRVNWDDMAGAQLVTSGTEGSMMSPSGERVTFNAGWNGDTNSFRVTVSDISQTSFGKVAGIHDVTLRQEAVCSGGGFPDRGATVPFGVTVGGFSGALFGETCDSGNCGSLFLMGQANDEFVEDTASGASAVVTPNVSGSGGISCEAAAAGQECDIVTSNTGVSAAVMGDAVLARLVGRVGECGSWTRDGQLVNCDSVSQVLGGTPATLVSRFAAQPGWWDTSLYGAYDTTNTTNHFWWDQPIENCDSPRIVSLPIVAADLGWQLGDPPTGWPPGKKQMRVVGMFDAILTDPDANSDFRGSGNLKSLRAAVIWFGPGATCADGRVAFGVLNGADGHDDRVLRLDPVD